MSADICLYKLSDAKFQNKGILAMSKKEFDALSDEEFDAMCETKDSDRFEDGQSHELVDLTYLKWCYGKTRGWNRVYKKFNALPIQSGQVDSTTDIHKYIVADLIGIYSGRYLRNRYYKKDCWLCLCLTKKEVETCLKRYGTNDWKVVFDLIVDRWEEGKTFLVITY